MIFLGDFEFYDPEELAHIRHMPKRIQNIEKMLDMGAK